VFAPPGVDLGRAFTTLYDEHHVGCAVMRGDLAGIRLCPHVYNTMDEVDTVVEVIRGLAQG
jgi:selenocysteine lyase/cysteine desulfurase